MINFIVGFILGIVVSAVGFQGLASYADQGIETIKQTVKEAQ